MSEITSINRDSDTAVSPVKINERKTERVIYTVKEISELLRTSPAFIYKLIDAGLLPALKLGSIRVRKEALDEFLQKYEGCDLSDLNHIKPIVKAS